MALPNDSEHEPAWELLGQQSDGAFFQELETEWIPEIGYASFEEAKHGITDYAIGYYCQFRPHTHNGGLAPNAAEKQYWIDYKTVAKKT